MSAAADNAASAWRRAYAAAVSRYRAQDGDRFERSVRELIPGADLDVEDIGTVARQLGDLATQGSIDAAAALLVLADDVPEDAMWDDDGTAGGPLHLLALDAAAACVKRSEDVRDGLATQALVDIFEEWADDEVAAGRMAVTLHPITGRKLYRSIKP